MTDALLLRHELSEEPDFGTEALVGLAEALPAGSIEVSSEGAGPVAPLGLDHVGEFLGSDSGSLVRSLAGQRRSLYFYNVERVPHYRKLLVDVLDGAVAALGVEPSEIGEPEGYVFVSGDVATTSAHLDHECNFLLVLRGTKRVYIASEADDRAHRALERMHSGGYGTTDGIPPTMRCFELSAGEGVYIPPLAVHYVENGAGVCTAFSAVFRHRQTGREVPVYAVNARLRRLGLSPRPPGGRLDPIKRFAFAAATFLRRMRRPPHHDGARA